MSFVNVRVFFDYFAKTFYGLLYCAANAARGVVLTGFGGESFFRLVLHQIGDGQRIRGLSFYEDLV